MELLSCQHGSSLKKRRPDGESGRAGSVIDQVSDQSFDVGTFENEDHDLIGQENAVPLEARQAQPVWSAPGDDLGCTLARARHEGGNDSYALIRARVGSPGSLSTEQPSDDAAEKPLRGAVAVVEGRWHSGVLRRPRPADKRLRDPLA
jgi:hypothetical protein